MEFCMYFETKTTRDSWRLNLYYIFMLLGWFIRPLFRVIDVMGLGNKFKILLRDPSSGVIYQMLREYCQNLIKDSSLFLNYVIISAFLTNCVGAWDLARQAGKGFEYLCERCIKCCRKYDPKTEKIEQKKKNLQHDEYIYPLDYWIAFN